MMMETNKNLESNEKKPAEHIIPIVIENDSNDSQNKVFTSLTTLTINEPVVDDVPPIEAKPAMEIGKLKEDPVSHISGLLIPVRTLPAQNVPEKIIICLDTCADPEFTAFKLGDGSKYSPIYMLKRTVELFVQNKNYIDSRHEFALLVLNKTSVKWVQEFTNNPRDIINALSDITESEQDDEFDLSLVLEEIWKNVTVPKPNSNLSVPPFHVVRLILLYSRSYCTPVVKKDFKELLSNPYFTIDVIMTHEETPVDNRCQEIFNSLQKLDDKGFAYNFEVGRNATALHDCMAKLLSHPLQRPIQSQAVYKVSPPEKDDI